jgi:hypothetical protein
MCFVAASGYEYIMNNSAIINSNLVDSSHRQSSQIEQTSKQVTSIVATLVLLGTVVSGSSQTAVAQSCNYFAGTAVTGQKVNVNTCSIDRANYGRVNFVYYLGKQQIASQANCNNGTWTSFPDRVVHRPQSQATQRMLDVVCSYK